MEDYNNQIEQLKEEMNDATHGADNIRNDISALAQRYAVIDRDEECGVLAIQVFSSIHNLHAKATLDLFPCTCIGWDIILPFTCLRSKRMLFWLSLTFETFC